MTRAPGVLCAGVEVALNRLLSQDPAALEECGRLAGRVIAVTVDGPGWSLYLMPGPRGVQVLDAFDETPAVRVTAPPTALLRQAWRSGSGGADVVAGVRVEGDAEVLSRFRAVLAKVGFDPEEFLAARLGDGAGHRAWQGLSGSWSWARAALATLGLDTAEYLREETRDLVHRDDVEQWMDGVDRLRDRVDRAQARLDRAAQAPGAVR